MLLPIFNQILDRLAKKQLNLTLRKQPLTDFPQKRWYNLMMNVVRQADAALNG
jgi:hypothetical protein